MSEYQYYEFQAIDRPLTKNEIAELRKLSSRASISAGRFKNVYNFGDFRGNPSALMEQYFDAFLYLSNFGTRQLMLRLPSESVDLVTAKQFCSADCASVRAKDDFVIFEFCADDEDSAGGWIEDDEAEEWLPSLVHLRSGIAKGDNRALYLAWLLCAQSGKMKKTALEPRVPENLGNLTTPLEAFVEFFQINKNLVAVAAQASVEPRTVGELLAAARI